MIGILGGTFDPIHNGHLITARAVLETRGLDKILFIPCSISPHKQGVKTSNNNDRLQMLMAAIGDSSQFEVSDYELMRGGISYSIETIEYYKKQYENIDLIIGYDNLPKFDTWKSYNKILDIVNLVVMKRSNEDLEVKNKAVLEKAIFVDTPFIEISSSEIRNRLEKKLPIDNLVPDSVKKYIIENSIYTA